VTSRRFSALYQLFDRVNFPGFGRLQTFGADGVWERCSPSHKRKPETVTGTGGSKRPLTLWWFARIARMPARRCGI